MTDWQKYTKILLIALVTFFYFIKLFGSFGSTNTKNALIEKRKKKLSSTDEEYLPSSLEDSPPLKRQCEVNDLILALNSSNTQPEI